MTLDDLHRLELARADMLGETPLSPEQIIALARHLAALDNTEGADWPDRLAAEHDCRIATSLDMFAPRQLPLDAPQHDHRPDR